MADQTRDVDAIRRRMAEIRKELHEDVRGVVAGTEAAFDWRYYVRLYPWAALGAAFVAGYFVVPRRRRDEGSQREESRPRAERAHREDVQEHRAEARKKSGVLGLALGFLGPIAVRAAQNYASHYVENLLQEHAYSGPVGAAPAGAGKNPASRSGRGPAMG